MPPRRYIMRDYDAVSTAHEATSCNFFVKAVAHGEFTHDSTVPPRPAASRRPIGIVVGCCFGRIS